MGALAEKNPARIRPASCTSSARAHISPCRPLGPHSRTVVKGCAAAQALACRENTTSKAQATGPNYNAQRVTSTNQRRRLPQAAAQSTEAAGGSTSQGSGKTRRKNVTDIFTTGVGSKYGTARGRGNYFARAPPPNARSRKEVSGVGGGYENSASESATAAPLLTPSRNGITPNTRGRSFLTMLIKRVLPRGGARVSGGVCPVAMQGRTRAVAHRHTLPVATARDSAAGVPKNVARGPRGPAVFGPASTSRE